MNTLTEIKSKNNNILNLSRIGIIYNTDHSNAIQEALRLEEILAGKGFVDIKKFAISGKSKKLVFPPPLESSGNNLLQRTMCFIIGGDGTFLGASRYFASCDIPLLGINTGRLGFLSQITPPSLENGLKKVLKGDFSIEERFMIQAKSSSSDYAMIALNDIVIKGGDISRTMKLFLYINNKHVCDYIADGLIISTPTGSTAYTLSAGGPVVVPQLEAFVIVPICPHTLTTRPIVIPADEKISVKIKSDSEFVYVTSDGQENIRLSANDTINIEKYEHKTLVINIDDEENGFYNLLRKKFHWGVPPSA